MKLYRAEVSHGQESTRYWFVHLATAKEWIRKCLGDPTASGHESAHVDEVSFKILKTTLCRMLNREPFPGQVRRAWTWEPNPAPVKEEEIEA